MSLSDLMAFEVIKKSLIENVLQPVQGDLFQTLDFPMPHLGSDGVLNERRKVAVYYAGGKFGGGLKKPFHNITINIEMTVAADSKADLLVLEKTLPEPEAQVFRRDALAQMKLAEARCDALLDELIRIVYQIVMNAKNRDLGVDRIEPSSPVRVQGRMVTAVDKTEPMRAKEGGDLVRMVALMTLECRADEVVDGAVPIGPPAGEKSEIDLELELNDDTVTKTGVFVEND